MTEFSLQIAVQEHRLTREQEAAACDDRARDTRHIAVARGRGGWKVEDHGQRSGCGVTT